MMVELKRISTALGLLAALTTSALAQGSAPNANQLTADSVAGTLRASRNLAGHRIEIQARDGVVTLTGELESPAQKAEALARTQYVAGVRSVVDQLSVSNERCCSHSPVPTQSRRWRMDWAATAANTAATLFTVVGREPRSTAAW